MGADPVCEICGLPATTGNSDPAFCLDVSPRFFCAGHAEDRSAWLEYQELGLPRRWVQVGDESPMVGLANRSWAIDAERRKLVAEHKRLIEDLRIREENLAAKIATFERELIQWQRFKYLRGAVGRRYRLFTRRRC